MVTNLVDRVRGAPPERGHALRALQLALGRVPDFPRRKPTNCHLYISCHTQMGKGGDRHVACTTRERGKASSRCRPLCPRPDLGETRRVAPVPAGRRNSIPRFQCESPSRNHRAGIGQQRGQLRRRNDRRWPTPRNSIRGHCTATTSAGPFTAAAGMGGLPGGRVPTKRGARCPPSIGDVPSAENDNR